MVSDSWDGRRGEGEGDRRDTSVDGYRKVDIRQR
jgi:hypothetical protein